MVVVLAVVKDVRETHEGLVPTVLGRLPVTRFGSCRATNGEDDIRLSTQCLIYFIFKYVFRSQPSVSDGTGFLERVRFLSESVVD